MNTDQNNQATTEFLNFSDALHHLRWGERIARRSWEKGVHAHVIYYVAAETSLILSSNDGETLRYSISGSDLMAEDWFVLGEHE